MKGESGDLQRLLHIKDAIEAVEAYTKGADFFIFSNNSMMKYAAIKQLEIIGEASRHLSENFKEKNNQINWKEIVGLRNILVHEYFGVDEMIIWQIISVDMPKLKSQLFSDWEC